MRRPLVQRLRESAGAAFGASLLALVAVAAGGCSDDLAFTCRADADCTADGAAGVCEPIGVCSYPNDACDSGRRYADDGTEFAGACVGDELGGDPFACVTSLEAGGQHACVVRKDKHAFCWGQNAFGQLGDGSLESRAEPVEVIAASTSVLLNVGALTAGGTHTCAVSGTTVHCWGHNDWGQLGVGDQVDAPRARDLGTTGIDALTAGAAHTCAHAPDGNAYCWGRNDVGQCANRINDCGTSFNATLLASPTTVASGCQEGALEGIGALAAGGDAGCALMSVDGSVRCFGSGLGGDANGHRPVPISVDGSNPLRDAVEVALGGGHQCFLTNEPALFCRGANASGQLGDGSLQDRAIPIPVIDGGTGEPLADVGNPEGGPSLALGANHSCAIRQDRTLWCWGENLKGQIGDGTNDDRPRPVRVADGVVRVAAGDDFTCVLRVDGAVRCWGGNAHGQLGDGSNDDSGEAVRVRLPCERP